MDGPPVMGSKWENFGSIVNVHQKSSLMEKTPNYHVEKILSLCILVSLFPQSLQLLLNRLKSKVALVSRIKVMQKLNIMDLTSPRLTYLLLLISDQSVGSRYPVWGTISGEPAINYAQSLSSWKGRQFTFLSDDYLAFPAHRAHSITI